MGAVAGAIVGTCYWGIYRLLVQSGAILARLDALELAVARLNFPATGLPGRWRGFQTRNQFEIDNILHAIVFRDEYGISGLGFRAEDVIIDVGAHIGAFTHLCQLKGSRAVYSFEPSEASFGVLEKNVGSLAGVHCSRAAVWRSDCGKTAQLRLSGPIGENTGANSVLAGGVAVDFRNQTLFPNYEAGDRVEVVSLDGILEQFERVKLLKLDCEGSEFPILLTSRRLGRVERIVGEIHECQEVLMRQLPAASRVLGYRDYRAENIVEYLESFGFLVSVRASGERIYLLDACRSEPARRSR